MDPPVNTKTKSVPAVINNRGHLEPKLLKKIGDSDPKKIGDSDPQKKKIGDSDPPSERPNNQVRAPEPGHVL